MVSIQSHSSPTNGSSTVRFAIVSVSVDALSQVAFEFLWKLCVSCRAKSKIRCFIAPLMDATGSHCALLGPQLHVYCCSPSQVCITSSSASSFLPHCCWSRVHGKTELARQWTTAEIVRFLLKTIQTTPSSYERSIPLRGCRSRGRSNGRSTFSLLNSKQKRNRCLEPTSGRTKSKLPKT